MKYLVEEIFGLELEQIVEYYADDQAQIARASAALQPKPTTNEQITTNDFTPLFIIKKVHHLIIVILLRSYRVSDFILNTFIGIIC